jgi:hypothetical protein
LTKDEIVLQHIS